MSRLLPIIAQGSIQPVYHGGHCVCVCVCLCLCVFAIACSPNHPLRTPDVHSPFVGEPRLHVSRLRPIFARGSIHPVYHEGHSVRVCVCHCLLTSPPLRPANVHRPLVQLVGGHAYMCQDCVRSLPEAPSILCITGDTGCVCLFVCVCVCVCHCLLPPPLTASSRCS